MNNLLNTKGLDISKPADFEKLIKMATEIEGQLKDFWGAAEQQMIERNIKQLKLECGTVSIAERKNWKATKQLPPRYYKQTLDTSKLNFLFKAGEKLPAGAEYTTSQYLTKRVK